MSMRLDERELQAWRGMLQVHAALTRRLDAELESAHGLAVPAYEVLMFVADAPDGKMRMSDLADRVLLSRSGLTRLVDRLVRDGLLVRVTCDDDLRGTYAKLTPAGQAKLDAARTTHLAGVREAFLGHFSPEEQDQLGALWARVLAS